MTKNQITYVHVSSKVESRINDLKKKGKEGLLLAHKAKRIIEGIVSGDRWHHMDQIGSYTKYGEHRIKNCRKYDLGCGYRLITLQRGFKMFIPFIGTHDDCQRWLKQYSRVKEFAAGNGSVFAVSPRDHYFNQTEIRTDQPDIVNKEEDVLSNLTDRELRQIFCGLLLKKDYS